MPAFVHHHDTVAHRQRLDLVVRHIDGGRGNGAVDLEDLGAHLHAQMGIQIGQWLVEQEHGWIAHDSAAEGDALALAA